MNYEEKYKKGLSFLKDLKPHMSDYCKEKLEGFFPELRDSKDERVRKGLIEHLKELKKQSVEGSNLKRPEHYDVWISWLEKQGEQKHEIVPKFRVGDTIRFKGNETLKGEDKIHRIIDYDNELYVFDDGTTDLFSEQNLYELVEQKQDWSEGDDIRFNQLIDFIQKYGLKYYASIDKVIDFIDWLKSIKPNHWKPSEEQMDALNAINLFGEISYVGQGGLLVKLYQDLKKLRLC